MDAPCGSNGVDSPIFTSILTRRLVLRAHLTIIVAAISGLLAISFLVIVAPARAAGVSAANTVFLPIVYSSGSPPPTVSSTAVTSSTPTPSLTATPTSSPTVTPTPSPTEISSPTPCSAQVLANPSFESGTAPWVLPGVATRVPTVGPDGSYAIELPVNGVQGQRYSQIIQTTTVPAWAQTGAFYFDVIMGAHDADGGDQLTVGLLDASSLQIVAWSTDSADSGYSTWTTIRLPIANASDYANQTMTVEFFALSDSDLQPTAWFVDNVRLVFACGSTVASQETIRIPDLARALRPLAGLSDHGSPPSGRSATRTRA